MKEHLILASASPRRQELLKLMGISFDICAAEVDEHVCETPEKAVSLLSERKARSVAALHPGCTVLGADTLVSCEGQTLGKPKDERDALRMLHLLSGRKNTVYTGVCVIDGDTENSDVSVCVTQVRFVPISEDAALRYIASGEPMDKAGAYGVQGMGGMFVSAIEGSPSNVIGLPMHLVREMLRKIGWNL